MAHSPSPAFVPVDVKDMRVGMYIKLDCHWVRHPFPHNTFKVQSVAELEVIRRLGPISIYVDHSRSDPESVAKLQLSQAARKSHEEAKQAAHHVPVTAEEQSIINKKEERIQTYLRCQEGLKKATADHASTLRQTKDIIDQVSAARDGCASIALEMIGHVTDALQGRGTAMAMLNINNSEDFGVGNFAALHSLNVFMVSMMIGRQFELSRADMFSLGIGALFHDIGERKIPSQVIAKRCKGIAFTRAEKTFFELHPEYGKVMIEAIGEFPRDSAQVVHQHHERIDGSGYPYGLKDAGISFLAKIVMVANEYDRLTNKMDPSKSLCPTEAFSHIYANRGKTFAENIIVTLIQTLSVYPPGTFVLLSDESFGMVVSTNFASSTRPIVMIYEPDTSMDHVVVVDLAEDQNLLIKKSLRVTELPQKVLDYWNPRRVAGYFFQMNDHADEPMKRP